MVLCLGSLSLLLAKFILFLIGHEELNVTVSQDVTVQTNHRRVALLRSAEDYERFAREPSVGPESHDRSLLRGRVPAREELDDVGYRGREREAPHSEDSGVVGDLLTDDGEGGSGVVGAAVVVVVAPSALVLVGEQGLAALLGGDVLSAYDSVVVLWVCVRDWFLRQQS